MISFFVLFGTTSLMANTKVDIIFVMDTSGSMDDEAIALKNAIATVNQDLSAIYDLETKSWGINYTKSSWGLTSNVRAEIGSSIATSNHSEDWGPATYDIATYYSDWRTDAIKIIVPISDEGPENGGGYSLGDTDLDQGDTIVTDKARTALNNTEVHAVPIISEGVYQDKIYKEYALLISDKAIKTGSGDLVEQFKTIIADIVAEASGTSLGSVNASFEGNFNGGKLIINAKGQSCS